MKRFLFILFALTIAVMSWEGQLSSANVKDNGPIPEQSIRLRILANSDSIQDQWLKREVRDAILAEMNTWAVDIASYDEARKVVAKRLPEMQRVAEQTIKKHGFSYKAEVDFGQVEFPTKLYGSYVYPAGTYEALRIRIGEAKGQNWWCVLFPPLCFIDVANGDAAVKTQEPAEPVENQAEKADATEGAPMVSPSDSPDERAKEKLDFTSRVIEENGAETEVKTEAYASAQDTSVPLETEEAEEEDQDQPIAVDTVDNSTLPVEEPKVEVRSFIWDKLIAWF